jgi:hypothetical protein
LNSDRQFARHVLISFGSANEVQDELDALDEIGKLPAAYGDLPGETALCTARIR